MTVAGAPVLVCGATGRQGGAVAGALLARGCAVRGLTRDVRSAASQALAARGAVLVQGDLDDPPSLTEAVAGVAAVFSVQDPWLHGEAAEVRQALALAQAAGQAGVRRFVQASVASADQPTGLPHFESKGVVERNLTGLGLDAVVIRPVFFMEFLMEAHEKKAPLILGMLKQGLRGETLQLVAVGDIGRTAADALLAPAQDRAGLRVVELAGDALTFREIMDTFKQVRDETPKVVSIPFPILKRVEKRAYLNYRWMGEHGFSVDLASQRAASPWLSTFAERLRRRP